MTGTKTAPHARRRRRQPPPPLSTERERQQWRAYVDARNRMRNHGVTFAMSWEEWRAIWEASGHWTERGRKKGQYVMARINSDEPFERGNVHIVVVDREYLLARRRRKANHKRGKRRARWVQ